MPTGANTLPPSAASATRAARAQAVRDGIRAIAPSQAKLNWHPRLSDPWNTTPQTPRDVMAARETRRAEFARLREMGVAGMKVDFFGGDGQDMIGYYHDLMTDAAGNASGLGVTKRSHGGTFFPTRVLSTAAGRQVVTPTAASCSSGTAIVDPGGSPRTASRTSRRKMPM